MNAEGKVLVLWFTCLCVFSQFKSRGQSASYWSTNFCVCASVSIFCVPVCLERLNIGIWSQVRHTKHPALFDKFINWCCDFPILFSLGRRKRIIKYYRIAIRSDVILYWKRRGWKATIQYPSSLPQVTSQITKDCASTGESKNPSVVLWMQKDKFQLLYKQLLTP